MGPANASPMFDCDVSGQSQVFESSSLPKQYVKFVDSAVMFPVSTDLNSATSVAISLGVIFSPYLFFC